MNRLLRTALLVASALPGFIQAQNLATRRLIDAAKTDQVPKCEAAVKEATGVEIPVEVDFASFGDDETFFFSLKDVLEGIAMRMKEVARNDAGKTAVAADVKKITITRDEGGYAGEFKDGTLALKASFVSNFAEPMAAKIKSVLEESL